MNVAAIRLSMLAKYTGKTTLLHVPAGWGQGSSAHRAVESLGGPGLRGVLGTACRGHRLPWPVSTE